MSNQAFGGRVGRDGFTCVSCKRQVPGVAWGTSHRNHCPACLWSRHVDEEPGDRRCACRAPMRPIGIEVRADGEWAIIHRCTGCNALRANRIAGDDHEVALLALALRPLANPAFPLDVLAGVPRA
jgi:RNHCP domain